MASYVTFLITLRLITYSFQHRVLRFYLANLNGRHHCSRILIGFKSWIGHPSTWKKKGKYWTFFYPAGSADFHLCSGTPTFVGCNHPTLCAFTCFFSCQDIYGIRVRYQIIWKFLWESKFCVLNLWFNLSAKGTGDFFGFAYEHFPTKHLSKD
jgi:hypothetical protein